MGFLSDALGLVKDVAGIAAPAIGGAIGGPVGAALGQAAGGLIAGGGRSGERATQQATAEQLEAIRQAQERVEQGAETSQGFLQPLVGVGQRGIDLAGILGDQQAQAQLAFNNPLFDLSRRTLTEDISQNAAARGRLTAGDTLQRLDQAGAVAAQPFIDRQRQDTFNLLNLAIGTAGQQVGVEQDATRQLTDLITGGGATQAAGTIAGENAAAARRGNIFDIGTQFVNNPSVIDLVKDSFGNFSMPTNNVAMSNPVQKFGFNMAGG